MRHHWPWLQLAGCAVAGVFLVCGCSPQTKRQWLNFFFTGIPPEKTNTVATVMVASTNKTKLPTGIAPAAEPLLVVHPPFAERKCEGCHESKFSNKLKASQTVVCLACHQSFLAPAQSRHAPAISGDCAICHEPHQSERKFLLTKASAILCAECHEPGDMAALAAHQQPDKSACTTCHNPHQSEDRFLLKPQARQTGATPAPGPDPVGTNRPAPPVLNATNSTPEPAPANRPALDTTTAPGK